VIGNAVRQLQYLVTDDSCIECYDLFMAESKNRGTGGNCGNAADRQVPEIVYQKKAEKLLADENCMKIIIVSLLEHFSPIIISYSVTVTKLFVTKGGMGY